MFPEGMSFTWKRDWIRGGLRSVLALGGWLWDGDSYAWGLLCVLPASASVGRKDSRIGQEGELNCGALKQRPQLNLEKLWGWGGPSDLTRIGERKPGLHSHSPSLNSHRLQAVLGEGSDPESGGSLQQRARAPLRDSAESCQLPSPPAAREASASVQGGETWAACPWQTQATSKAKSSIKNPADRCVCCAF